MVVHDKQDYINKAQDLLVQKDPDKPLTTNPTNKHENKLINMLRTVKAEEDWSALHTNDFIQLAQVPQNSMGFPKSKKGYPLRPIMSSSNTVTYGLAKELDNILRQLLGHSPHHIRNTQDFVKSIRLIEGENITSYDVKALFISVLVDPVISIFRHKLEQDTKLHLRTSLSIQHITTLLEFCLKTHLWPSKISIMNRCMGQDMGSFIQTIVTNLFMTEVETRAINTGTHSPKMWLMYVDDTFSSKRQNTASSFYSKNNSFDLHIQFTQDAPYTDGSIPFLDTLVSQGPDNILFTIVCRKPAHTDQYLHWDSHHNLSAKYSVFNTLTPKDRTVCTNTQLLHKRNT